MTPGTIIFDNQFVYDDGSIGRKLLVVLNDGQCGHYITVKTTSKSHYKGNQFGCQNQDRYANFYLPLGSCCLKDHTWIQLDRYFEFKAQDILNAHFSGRINRIGVLADNLAIDLIQCAIDSDDISDEQENVLKEIITVLRPIPT